ncbi:MAG: DUF3108 domain-containing protein [Bacteroidales bacterium]|nr:DUF3108 domain-containing protein [Bacteroidales bacterium]
MKTKLLAILCLLALSGGAYAAEYPFRSGETLDFRLMFKWGGIMQDVGAARVVLDSTVYAGTAVYHTEISARSSKFFDAFYKIREHFQSWFTVEDLTPLKFIRQTEEGRWRAWNLYRYDWDRNLINAEINLNKPSSTIMEVPVHQGVCDLPALVYRLRNMDFSSMEEGQKMMFTFAIDDDIFDIVMTYHGEQPLKIRRMGTVMARRLSCTVVSGVMFEGSEELQFWLSADDNAIPVAFMAPLRVGAVWAWLRGCEGLKYPGFFLPLKD